MKTKQIIATLIVVALSTLYSVAQNKIYEKFEDMDDVTSIHISSKMFEMMSGNISPNGVDLEGFKDKVKSLVVLTANSPQSMAKLKAEGTSLISKGSVQIIRVNEGADKVIMYITEEGDKISELIMVVQSKDDYTLIIIEGAFTMEDIKKIADQN